VNRLSLQTILRVPAVCLPLLGGQNGGEGDNMRVRLRFVRCPACGAVSGETLMWSQGLSEE
jgi:hypothetical protein